MRNARNPLIDRTIINVRALTPEEKEEWGWSTREQGSVLILDDGSRLYALRDSEGNGPGVFLFQDHKTNAERYF